MPPLPKEQRKLLETTVVSARDVAEDAARAALRALSVDRDEAHAGIGPEDRALRVALRAQARQLGDFELLVAQVAYVQWHRMLFARFLAENDLLVHPSGVLVTLEECADLAESEGERDGWLLAARYAARMLPGIFPLEDPSARVSFAREGTAALEQLLAGLPPELFRADDSLGWVYQFWQSKKKKEVNASERKIGGADLAPVTQLFTEHYMVAFLLENSLGAWWAARHPQSPLLKDFQYLRYAEDGTPAAGTFEGWPKTVAEVTMMDPCSGSGHFHVTGFHMFRRMREEEEGLSPQEAADAVLRDNLFGLELDGRCVQIAVFALALEAWKVGGYRELPTMNIACSGIPARGTVEDWRGLAAGDQRLESALERLYYLFKDADSLGSLIDPRRAADEDELLGASYEEVEPLLHRALDRFGGEDPAPRVFETAAADVVKAARLLVGRYTLVATNPPFLGFKKITGRLRPYLAHAHPASKMDLAVAFIERGYEISANGGTLATVAPQSWLYIGSYTAFREKQLARVRFGLIARLGSGAFEAVSGEIVAVVLMITNRNRSSLFDTVSVLDCSKERELATKIEHLKSYSFHNILQSSYREDLEKRITFTESSGHRLLSEYADGATGVVNGDFERWIRCFWELPRNEVRWERLQSTGERDGLYSGRHWLIDWRFGGVGMLRPRPDNPMLGRRGVALNRMTNLAAAAYEGDRYDQSIVACCPKRPEWLLPVLAFCRSELFPEEVRRLDNNLNVTTATLLKVPFDLDHWTKVAADQYPDGLPEPHSDDPTQWLFEGNIADSETPLHVAVARLLGYSWPDQEPDAFDRLADSDGIVCLVPVAGERSAADRLRELLVAVYGSTWSESLLDGFLGEEGSGNLENWLRDEFFASHAKLFHNRPFIWQVWDGRKDGFSALLNYHKLGKQGLEKLTFHTLQWWIDRQRAEAEAGTTGAQPRLAAARQLQEKLAAILGGEPPYDIYVRWKPLAQQPIGWDPDLNDGARLNIRPFVEAGVLRSKFNVHWKKDRGKNPDGSDRHNDLHFTIAEKLEARRAEGSA